MKAKPIIVGVDLSPQAASAAAFGWRIAQLSQTDCYFVHGVRPLFRAPAPTDYLADVNLLLEQQLEASKIGLLSTLRPALPEPALKQLDIRFGRGAGVVAEVAQERGADLIVLGSKHHSAFGRWMGGSTAHHLVRTTDIPVLVTGEGAGKVDRILVAADLSYAVQPTFQAAVRMAHVFNAHLRVAHAVEPLPIIAELPPVRDEQAFYDDSREQFQRCLEPLTEDIAVETAVLRGLAAEVLSEEARAWQADLVVVGSHGKGWIDRLLVGSTTERLLDQLPTSLLVIPVPLPAGEGRRARGQQKAVRRGWAPQATVVI